MKSSQTLLFLLFLTLSVTSWSQICDAQQIVVTEDGSCDYSPWILAFEDNFDGSTISLENWKTHYPWGRSLLGAEQQYYADENIEVVNGTANLVVKEVSLFAKVVGGSTPDNEILHDGLPNKRHFDYTSGMMFSRKRYGYGKYEVRCKLPKGKGFWPAFWTYSGGNNCEYNEIDIFEFWNEDNCFGNYDPNRLSKNPHFNNIHDWDNDCSTEDCGTDVYGGCSQWNGPDYSQSFHTFTMIWDNYKIEWIIDGQVQRTSYKFYTLLGQPVDCNSLQAFQPYLLNKAFPEEYQNIIINLAIQSGNAGPDSDNLFPSEFEIDYVRYYQKKPCESVVIAGQNENLIFSQEQVNLVLGSEVILQSNISMTNDDQLFVMAREVINIVPGVSINSGANFVGYIDQSATCQNTFFIPLDHHSIVDTETTLHEVSRELSELGVSEGDDELGNEQLLVYPSPFTRSLTIENKSNVGDQFIVSLIDSKGNTVKREYSLSDKEKIIFEIPELSAGIYFVKSVNTRTNEIVMYKVLKI
jgi:beta-glucanase (GH16 family)